MTPSTIRELACHDLGDFNPLLQWTFADNEGVSARHEHYSEAWERIENLPENLTGMVEVVNEYGIALGRGSSSLVMEGRLTFKGNTHKVAIKSRYFGAEYSQPDNLKQAAERTAREVKVLRKLSHPNVMNFLGVAVDVPRDGHKKLMIISSVCEEQHLKIYLKRNTSGPRLPLALDIASGLEYLHSRNIVHGQLKPRNVAVKRSNNGVRCVLTDFSYAGIIGDDTFARCRPGIYRYTPHEIARPTNGQYALVTKASDVYAFAFVMLLVISNAKAFKEDNHFVVLRRLLDGERPDKKDHSCTEMSQLLWQLLEECWTQAPIDRPSIVDVVNRLRPMM